MWLELRRRRIASPQIIISTLWLEYTTLMNLAIVCARAIPGL